LAPARTISPRWNGAKLKLGRRSCISCEFAKSVGWLLGYLSATLFFCPRYWPNLSHSPLFGVVSSALRRNSSRSTGGLPFPARPRIRKLVGAIGTAPRSRKYSSVRAAETFSATATLMSWFRATPSNSAALRNSSSKEGCNRPHPAGFLEWTTGCGGCAKAKRRAH
jgi:hypothetical protein